MYHVFNGSVLKHTAPFLEYRNNLSREWWCNKPTSRWNSSELVVREQGLSKAEAPKLGLEKRNLDRQPP